MGSDGNIYGIPSSSHRVLKISPDNQTVSFIGGNYTDPKKWSGGVLVDDNIIFACPFSASKILKINTTDQTTSLVGDDLGNEEEKWSGFMKGPDGNLYGTPYASSSILIFDPRTEIAMKIDMNRKNDEILKQQLSSNSKWTPGGVIQDIIYVIPYDSSQILSLEPIHNRE